MVDSVPEKTLENWASIYITYRFRSHAGLWWPTTGEDISVGHIPKKPGKHIFLEMKTSSVDKKRPDRHVVQIDRPQLDQYLKLPVGLQPFYVFPRPTWKGEVKSAARKASIDETDIGFSRNAYKKPVGWSADWLRVLSAKDVSAAINMKARKPTLVTYTVRPNGTVSEKWAQKTATPSNLMPWRDFWTSLTNCGQSNWPQVISIPYGTVANDEMSRQSLLNYLKAASDPETSGGQIKNFAWDENKELYSETILDSAVKIESISNSIVGVQLSLGSLFPNAD